MDTIRRLLSLGAACALSAACAPHRTEGHAPPDPGCATVFLIENQGIEAVDVFLHRGVLIRLGRVPASRSVHLASRVAHAQGTKIRLIARPASGGRSVATDELYLGAGDRVRWTVTQLVELAAITAVIERAPASRPIGDCPP